MLKDDLEFSKSKGVNSRLFNKQTNERRHPRPTSGTAIEALLPVNSKTAHVPPPTPGQTPGRLKNVGQIPRYVASLDGQMPHPLDL